MLRSTRPIMRLVPRAIPIASSSLTSFSTKCTPYATSKLHIRPRRPALTFDSSSSSLSKHCTYTTKSGPPRDGIDRKSEKELAQKIIEARPDEVTIESSRRQFIEPSQAAPAQGNDDVMKGLQHDVGIVKDTFALDNVPREPYALGLAGTLPYLATSVSTVYLSWDLNTTWPSTSVFLNHIYMSHDTAQYWLGLLEPIQLGYGAVIISFLGAVHWGMEYTERESSAARTRFRYGIGVLAPVVAWPTLLMPVEYALTAQFAAFTFLYLADARATVRGWAPVWYGTFRFVLTAIVGLAIFVSLVGRAKIGSSAPRLGQSMVDSLHQDRAHRSTDWVKLEEEEKQKIKKEKEEKENRKKEEEKKRKNGGSKSGSKKKGNNEKNQESEEDSTDKEAKD